VDTWFARMALCRVAGSPHLPREAEGEGERKGGSGAGMVGGRGVIVKRQFSFSGFSEEARYAGGPFLHISLPSAGGRRLLLLHP